MVVTRTLGTVRAKGAQIVAVGSANARENDKLVRDGAGLSRNHAVGPEIALSVSFLVPPVSRGGNSWEKRKPRACQFANDRFLYDMELVRAHFMIIRVDGRLRRVLVLSKNRARSSSSRLSTTVLA